MSLRRLTAALAGLAVVAALPVAAQAGSGTDRATGGGQILFSSKGAGNTISFTAQGTEAAATGRVTFIDRQNGETWHGIVKCLRVSGSYAEISGVERDRGTAFNLRVQDNGEGSAAENDLIQFDTAQDVDCGQDNGDDQFDTELGRGNAQVYDASASSSKKKSAATRSSSVSALRIP